MLAISQMFSDMGLKTKQVIIELGTDMAWLDLHNEINAIPSGGQAVTFLHDVTGNTNGLSLTMYGIIFTFVEKKR